MSDENLVIQEEKFRSIIEIIDIANTLTEPINRSIVNLLRISADQMNSDEASVIIRDGDEGDMKFLAAIGKVADQVINLKIPSGKGIAGFVISSGQPMAVSEVGEENSFYAEVDKQTGYSTQTILATPLRYNDDIIGVLEYINRKGEPPFEAFTPEEMDKAAIFADTIASLVNVYEVAELFRNFSSKMLSGDGKFNEVREWLKNVRDSAEHKEMIDLALILREIAGRGETERRMCLQILEAILQYTDNTKEISYLNF
ncbi:hypothetical protein BH20ACI1_BH20ACI1_29000 [soil metagenome]